MKKIDDKKVTAKAVDQMTPATLKAFENRLRREAERQGLAFGKFVHPFLGPMYALKGAASDDNKGGLKLLELRDYLYRVK